MSFRLKEIIQHSGIYAVGTILSRFASILMLPVYTAFLTPADYGVIALLDLTVVVLGIFIRSGLSEAVSRSHFHSSSTAEQNSVWWTGFTIVSALATFIVVPAWLFRDSLAELTLNISADEGGRYYALVLPTLWFGSVGTIFEVYLRVAKRSVLYVSVSLGKLLLNIALNVLFLVYFQMGITGILIGNLLSRSAMTLVLSVPFARGLDRFCVSKPTARALIGFGSPLVITTLLAFLMHNADRYFLQHFSTMTQVGIYALAYQIGQGVNMLILLPFDAIWGVVMYEVADDYDAAGIFARVFRHFTSMLIVCMLGVSLIAKPLLWLIADESYQAAADVVPIICLAYIFYASGSFFEVAAKVHGKTTKLLSPSVIGCAVNVVLNCLLIPMYGMYGAALATLGTYTTWSVFSLLVSRGIDTIGYPWGRQLLLMFGGIGTYCAVEFLVRPAASPISFYLIAAAVFIAFSCVAFADVVRAARLIPGEGEALQQQSQVAPSRLNGLQ